MHVLSGEVESVGIHREDRLLIMQCHLFVRVV